MWLLVSVLLLIMRSWSCGSAQLLFNETKSVTFNTCNETILIPCYVTNVEAENIQEMFIKWKFKGKPILVYDGAVNRSYTDDYFVSAEIDPSQLLTGNASLKLDKEEAKAGKYVCEVTELSREGTTAIELKYRVVLWFPLGEHLLIIIFPILAILFFWAQFRISIKKYKTNPMNMKTIILSGAGLLVTIVAIIGAILFIPGDYSKTKCYGLVFFVNSLVIFIFLHYYKFKPAIGMTVYVMNILPVIQVLGYSLTVAGLHLCLPACVPKHGPLLVSGLGIIALAELLGLAHMKSMPKLI